MGAHALAEKIRESVASLVFPEVQQVTVSLGIAEYQAGEFLDTWVQRADQAMYRAKAGGRNQSVIVHDATVTVQSSSSSLLELHWDPKWECGQVVIDAQHRKLFDLANGLLPFLGDEELGADFQLRLHVLLAHVAQHFHDEETLLAQASYPRLAEHAKAHRTLLARAKELQAVEDPSKLDRNALLGFLALDLIKGHILTEDHNFFQLFEDIPVEMERE
jgi:hemerythrin-like metal-binding protein